MTKWAVREAVECAEARALSWVRGTPWTGWAIGGPSVWRDGDVPIAPDAALASGLIGVRHFARRSYVYVTKRGREMLSEHRARGAGP